MGKILLCDSLRKRNAEPSEGSGDILELKTLDAKELKDFCTWMHEVSVRMRLSENRILLAEQHCEPGHYASIEPDFSYRTAQVYLCPEFHRLPAEVQRATMVHEFLHVHMKSLLTPWESLEEILSQDAWSVVAASGVKSEENIVTVLEWIISPNMPLPPIRKPLKTKAKS